MTICFPKLRTAADVPLVAAIAPSELSAAFASSRNAKILASFQPPALAELVAIAEVSVVAVLDAAVVSAAPLSFLLHAATAAAATARVATLKRVAIVRPPLFIGIRAKTVHTSILPTGIPPSPTPAFSFYV